MIDGACEHTKFIYLPLNLMQSFKSSISMPSNFSCVPYFSSSLPNKKQTFNEWSLIPPHTITQTANTDTISFIHRHTHTHTHLSLRSLPRIGTFVNKLNCMKYYRIRNNCLRTSYELNTNGSLKFCTFAHAAYIKEISIRVILYTYTGVHNKKVYFLC